MGTILDAARREPRHGLTDELRPRRALHAPLRGDGRLVHERLRGGDRPPGRGPGVPHLRRRAPPLRDRRDDIPRLAIHFLDQYSRKLGIPTPKLRQRHIIELQQYPWPGNIRELQNVVERAVISGRTGHLELHLPQSKKTGNKDIEMSPIRSAKNLMTDEEMRLFERQNLTSVLEHHNWKISGEGGAAEYLGLHPATLSSRMRAMGVKRPR